MPASAVLREMRPQDGPEVLEVRGAPGAVEVRRLYERCGFVVEGVLREEFLLDGRYVDDVLMARHLAPPDAPAGAAP